MRKAYSSWLLAFGHLSVLVGVLLVSIESYLCLNSPKAKSQKPLKIIQNLTTFAANKLYEIHHRWTRGCGHAFGI